jgi:hypothetical protein
MLLYTEQKLNPSHQQIWHFAFGPKCAYGYAVYFEDNLHKLLIIIKIINAVLCFGAHL